MRVCTVPHTSVHQSAVWSHQCVYCPTHQCPPVSCVVTSVCVLSHTPVSTSQLCGHISVCTVPHTSVHQSAVWSHQCVYCPTHQCPPVSCVVTSVCVLSHTPVFTSQLCGHISVGTVPHTECLSVRRVAMLVFEMAPALRDCQSVCGTARSVATLVWVVFHPPYV